MIENIEIREHVTLGDYASYAHLAATVNELFAEAASVAQALEGRTVWMVNSTARGGGVAEMLPKVVGILRELGVRTEWLVVTPEEEAFFSLTKRIHNMIHGVGSPGFSAEERALYARVSADAADAMEKVVAPDDLLVIHDPQPLGAGAEFKRRTGVRAIWRCHIGLDRSNAATDSAWELLENDATVYDHAVFSAPEYIPPYLAGNASIISPAIDPLSHKNRELPPHKLVGVLCNAGLMEDHHPVLTPPWDLPARRLHPDGSFVPANAGEEIGLLYRPIVTQVSRWDRLKGFRPLVEGFLRLKRGLGLDSDRRSNRNRRFAIARLVLAGPDPSAVQDDPEGQEVLRELCDLYAALTPEEQKDVALLTLPMRSLKENALMVNALQRCSTVVVQNSLQEGFGLTATEAMWKRLPVLGSNACGLRQQIRDGVDGRLNRDAEDPAAVAEILDEMLSDPAEREVWGRSAQRRVHDRFLVFAQVREWLQRLAAAAERPRSTPTAA